MNDNTRDALELLSGQLLDQTPPLRVSHRFETIVRAELAIDVMQMVPKRLRRDGQLARNRRGIAAFGEEREDPPFLV